MPMVTKQFPDLTKRTAKSIRTAFNKTEDEEEKPEPVGHTRLDEEQEGSFGSKITAAIKKRRGMK